VRPVARGRLERTTMPLSPLKRMTVPVPPRPACLERSRRRLVS
jgi:hypothetical protein